MTENWEAAAERGWWEHDQSLQHKVNLFSLSFTGFQGMFTLFNSLISLWQCNLSDFHQTDCICLQGKHKELF